MPRTPTRLALRMHEAGHAIVQLANGPAPWIDSIAVDGLPAGILGLVETMAMWQPYVMRGTADPETRAR